MRFLRKIKFFFKAIAFLLLLAVLAIAGFAAGIYFELIDSEQTKQVNEALNLYKLPFVGEYFDIPEGAEWTREDNKNATESFVNAINEGIDSATTTVTEVADQIMKPEPEPEPPKSKEIKISQKEIEEKMQEREAAEKKRISKLARVYASMKADAAAEAIGNLDSDTAILILQKMEDDAAAQILAKMDPFIAAQLTEMMLRGVERRGPLPAEIRQQLEEEARQREAAAPTVEGAVVDEEYVEGEYVEGEYPEGEYTEGEYVEEEYVEPEYTEEEYVEGEEPAY